MSGKRDKGKRDDPGGEKPRDFTPTWGSPPGGPHPQPQSRPPQPPRLPRPPRLPGALPGSGLPEPPAWHAQPEPPVAPPAPPLAPPPDQPPLQTAPPIRFGPPAPPAPPEPPEFVAPPAFPEAPEVFTAAAGALKPRIAAPSPFKRLRPRKHHESPEGEDGADETAMEHFPRSSLERYVGMRASLKSKPSRVRLILIIVAIAVFGVIALVSSLSTEKEKTSTTRPSTRNVSTTQGTGQLLVTVDYPAAGAALTADTIDVTGKVTTKDFHPLAAAEVTVKGSTQSEVKGETDENGRFSIQVRLSPGDNSITVTAYGLSTWGKAVTNCKYDSSAAPGAVGQ